MSYTSPTEDSPNLEPAAAGSNHSFDSGRPKKRVKRSCDICKNRKTKCVVDGPGPCVYCKSIGATCGTSLQPKRRPFYRVSEEEYDACVALLRYFVPDTELDLPTMKRMIGEFEKNPPTGAMQANGPIFSPLSFNVPDILPSVQNTVEAEQSTILLEDHGCMIIDSLGKYRYVGVDSSLRFNHASHAARKGPRPDPKIILPLQSGPMPPLTPDTDTSSSALACMDKIYLPDHDVCMRYVGRFMDEIHSVFWFYSSEEFYGLIDKMYEDGGASASASWMCSFYSICALCSQTPPNGVGEFGQRGDVKTSLDYLAMAKALLVKTCDEADLEGVRALSLAMQSLCYSVSAYLMLGTTVSIAFSLGQHRNMSATRKSVEREQSRRLWWTVYQLDQEISYRLGYPTAICDESIGVQTPLPSEQILHPGATTPLGYQGVCVSLVRLKKKISQSLYVIPAQNGGKVSFHQVTHCITALRDWLAAMPEHLQWDSSVPPSHRRAICVLYLRYWTTLVHVTRPFLLYAVVRSADLQREENAAKRKWYAELSCSCIRASESAVLVLKRMMEYKNLSSMVLFDSGCIQELVQILTLSKYKWNTASCQENIETCVKAIRSMEPVGWCEKVLPEIEALVEETSNQEGSVHSPQPGMEAEVQVVDAELSHVSENFLDQLVNFEFDFDPQQIDDFDTVELDFGINQSDLYF